MKYLLFSLFLWNNPLIAQKIYSHKFTLRGGATFEISHEKYDSLITALREKEKDSVFAQVFDMTPIYEMYYQKRNKIFANMINAPTLEFTARDTEGYEHSPFQYRGRVLILHFWLFWGTSFDKEIPILNTLTEKYAKEGLAVLSFTSTLIREWEKDKLKEHAIHFPLIENAFNFTNDFFKMSLIRPCLIVVDKMGNMRYLYDGDSYNKALANKDSEGISEFERCIQDLLK